jgi:hypothetical protein
MRRFDTLRRGFSGSRDGGARARAGEASGATGATGAARVGGGDGDVAENAARNARS